MMLPRNACGVPSRYLQQASNLYLRLESALKDSAELNRCRVILGQEKVRICSLSVVSMVIQHAFIAHVSFVFNGNLDADAACRLTTTSSYVSWILCVPSKHCGTRTSSGQNSFSNGGLLAC